MSQRVVVSIPHRLGKQEALRRIQGGLGRARTDFAAYLTVMEETWTGEHLDFRVGVLRQATSGSIDVADDHVRLEVELPWLLAQLAEKAKALIQRQGRLMLEKK
jgi:Putative polyhydroxyalkanoic acid system protein (PHA_gran_rgn)